MMRAFLSSVGTTVAIFLMGIATFSIWYDRTYDPCAYYRLSPKEFPGSCAYTPGDGLALMFAAFLMAMGAVVVGIVMFLMENKKRSKPVLHVREMNG